MTLYPHEWLLEKLKPFKEFTIVSAVASGVVLSIGYVVFWYASVASPTTDSWTLTTVSQPGLFSYSWYVVIGLIVLFVSVWLYYGLPPGYHGRPK